VTSCLSCCSTLADKSYPAVALCVCNNNNCTNNKTR